MEILIKKKKKTIITKHETFFKMPIFSINTFVVILPMFVTPTIGKKKLRISFHDNKRHNPN